MDGHPASPVNGPPAPAAADGAVPSGQPVPAGQPVPDAVPALPAPSSSPVRLPDTVREAGRRFGVATALVEPDGARLSFAELDQHSDSVAAGLAARGLGPGDRIVLRLPSRGQYVLAYLAAAKLGAVTAGVNPALAPPEQERLTESVDPKLVLSEPGEVDELLRWARGSGARAQVPATPPADPARPVAIVFTSGTTGAPKAAVFTEAQLDAVALIDTGREWAGTPGEPMLNSTQFAHVGFMTKLPWYMRRGLRIHLQDRWDAGRTLALLAAQRVPVVNAVAPQLALMLRHPDFDGFDLSAVQMLVAGAAASPPALVAEARRRFGAPCCVRYSSTETGGCGLGTAPDADDDEAMHSVGRPRPGIRAQIRDDDGRPMPTGEVGELWLHTPSAMAGYWRNPQATAEALVDGWVCSGDLALVDERGLVRLRGRKKEMYIRGGYNVIPAEVEALLSTHPLVAECAVQPRADEILGERGVAVVVARDPDRPPTLADLTAHLRGQLATYKLPEDLVLVDALPLTPLHKIDRSALADLVARTKT
ncbi:class I adenylate-forming enzyme family protein [Parafrankia sp. EUN1f]|uniref:class I adenylate-forming enzyme family protein n=1 Tax=Parafrankia sp. EUN1f TaxID=102897 RepID=UPI0001C45321|nr:AMP-binding protein [Parafrankia sp. EUN1f]EFC78958.1 AMP-dependent synthetase and ligase [Parafrankia sp. EUN1f]